MSKSMEDPTKKYEQPNFSTEKQDYPGVEGQLFTKADHGENSYKGSGKLEGKRCLITGGDSGIGKAVAIAFAREGADVFISYLNEDEDAKDTASYVEKAGRKAFLMPGDISKEEHCKNLVQKAVSEMGGLDVIVNNAAFQMSHDSLQDLTAAELYRTYETNVFSMFWICKEAEQHLKPGSTIVNTTSVNAYKPSPQMLAYASTKGAIQNFTAGLAQLWAEKGIRVNCVAPGPFITPLINSTMPEEKIKTFGQQTPMKRPGQPAELAAVYVLLASEDSSYMSASTIQVTGGVPCM